MKKLLFILVVVSFFAFTACGGGSNNSTPQGTEKGANEKYYYTCTMHPEVHQDKLGKCPICGMELVKKEGTYNQQKAK